MRTVLALLITTITLTLTAGAGATVGGPSTLEAVGLDAQDKKIYFVEEFWDEGERLPQLHYMFLEGEHAGRLIHVCSWYRDAPGYMVHKRCAKIGRHQGDGEEALLAFNDKLAKLQRRLTPLKEMKAADATLQSFKIGEVKTKDFADFEWEGDKLRLVVRHKLRGGIKNVVVYNDKPAKVEKAFEVPGIAASLAIVRYLGIAFEIGYTEDTAVLLR